MVDVAGYKRSVVDDHSSSACSAEGKYCNVGEDGEKLKDSTEKVVNEP